MLITSRMVEKLHFSTTIKLADKVRELEARGDRIIKLGGGEPYFSTPEEIKIRASQALFEGNTFYGHSRGLIELRKKIIAQYNEKYGVSFDHHQNILITPGCKQAILYFILSVVDHGDEVIIPTPSWMSYGEIVKMAGGNPIFVPCSNKTFDVSADMIIDHITEKTKAIILNSPNNPTGRVINKFELERISEICRQKNIFLLVDEIYEKLIFAEVEHHSIVGVDKDLKHSVLVNGFSKAYSMTGWRIGYIIADDDLITKMLKIQQNSITCPTTFAQFGAVTAIEKCDDFIKKGIITYQENRDFLIKELQSLKKFDYIFPQGSFYLFINISTVNNSSFDFCVDLLERCKVSAVPGLVFGENAEGYIRVNLGVQKSDLIEFVKRLKEHYEADC